MTKKRYPSEISREQSVSCRTLLRMAGEVLPTKEELRALTASEQAIHHARISVAAVEKTLIKFSENKLTGPSIF